MTADPFGRSRLPHDFSREGRIALIDEVAQALLKVRTPSSEAASFVGAALSSWLAGGGSLERDYFRVTAPAGSHHTPAHLWRELSSSSRGTTYVKGSDTIAPVQPDDAEQ